MSILNLGNDYNVLDLSVKKIGPCTNYIYAPCGGNIICAEVSGDWCKHVAAQ